MSTPAGDEKTRYILQKKYSSVGCYVCKSPTHTYLACPSRPCYLCKKEGHLSHACPYRLKPGAHAAALRTLLAARSKRHRLGPWLRARELDSSPNTVHPALLYFPSPQFRAKAAVSVRRVHAKRITAAEWLPDGRAVVLADKGGAVRVWNLGRAVDGDCFDVEKAPAGCDMPVAYVHHCNINTLAFDTANREVMYSTASDGIVCETRLNLLGSGDGALPPGDSVQEREEVFNFNPEGWHGQRNFKMAYGMAYDSMSRRCLYVGVSSGAVIRIDPREDNSKRTDTDLRYHKDKVTCIDLNANNSDLIATASNDKKVCLWDARKFEPGYELGAYEHGRVVSSAYFSPNTGSRLLTTSLENKIRVWEDVHAFVGDVNKREDGQPREIVHSHNFHRYLNPFRATWDPKDFRDDLFMCGRFLGDAYYEEGDGIGEPVVLHPIDLFSARTGTVVHSLVDPGIELRCTTNKFSPTRDFILTAASTDVILWSPPMKGGGLKESGMGDVGRGSRRDRDERDSSESEEDEDPSGRKKRMRATTVVSKRRTRTSARRQTAP